MPSRGGAAVRVAVASGAALLLAACGGGPERGDGAASTARHAAVPGARRAGDAPDDRVRAGEAIYRREHCDRCHTLLEKHPPEGPFDLPRPIAIAPGGSRVGPDLGREGHRRSDDWQYAHLYAPDVLVPGSRMPASRHLFVPGGDGAPRPNPDGEALVAWLQSLGRSPRDAWSEFRAAEPEIPPKATGAEAAARRRERGGALYAVECAACHGAAGDGRGPAAALLDRAPRDFTLGVFRFRSAPAGETVPETDLFRTVTIGSGTGAAMPSFAHLPAEDRWALVEAVRAFSEPVAVSGIVAEEGARAARVPGRDAGARFFAAWGCPACHGNGAEGRAAPPAADGAGPAWRDESGRPIAGTGDLRHLCGWRGGGSPEALTRALRFGVGPAMPSFAAMLEAEPGAASAIRAWLLSLDPEAAGAAVEIGDQAEAGR